MKHIMTIFLVILLASCNIKKKPAEFNTKLFADTLSLPKDSLGFYYPAKIFSDKPSLDSFVQNWYSSALYSFKEPLLSQNYIGHDVYRFLWLRSFHRPVVFTLQKMDSKIGLTTKMLDKQPMFHDDHFIANDSIFSKGEKQEYINAGYSIKKRRPHYLVYEKKADRTANIIYNRKQYLSIDDWNKFEQLLLKANFWKLPTNIDDGSTDGAQWIIEGHLKRRYHVVNSHGPLTDGYGELGVFLIKLSGLDETIY